MKLIISIMYLQSIKELAQVVFKIQRTAFANFFRKLSKKLGPTLFNSSNLTPRLWNVDTGEQIRAPFDPGGIPRYARVHDDGSYLSTYFEKDGFLVHRAWSLSSGMQVTAEIRMAKDQQTLEVFMPPLPIPFSSSELDQIDAANGIRMDENGLTDW